MAHNIDVLACFLKNGLAVVGDHEESERLDSRTQHQNGQQVSLQMFSGSLSNRQPLVAVREDRNEDAFQDCLREPAVIFFGYCRKEVIAAFERASLADKYSLLEYWEYMKYLPQASAKILLFGTCTAYTEEKDFLCF